jgi:hypothetical protein
MKVCLSVFTVIIDLGKIQHQQFPHKVKHDIFVCIMQKMGNNYFRHFKLFPFTVLSNQQHTFVLLCPVTSKSTLNDAIDQVTMQV